MLGVVSVEYEHERGPLQLTKRLPSSILTIQATRDTVPAT